MYSDANMAAAKERLKSAVSSPQDQQQLKKIQDWFMNDKPAIDRRANKNKKIG